jgi:hypothetical protein
MFFDVVYRHGRAIDEWLIYLRSLYEELLGDAEIQFSFSAGLSRWRVGLRRYDDVATFVAALKTAGFAWDSSASRGVLGLALGVLAPLMVVMSSVVSSLM